MTGRLIRITTALAVVAVAVVPRRDDRAGDPEAAGRVVLPVVREHRRRAERALASVVAARYLLGVLTRRVGKLAVSLGERPVPITSDVPRSRPIVEKSEGGHGRPPVPITSDVPRSRPIVEKSEGGHGRPPVPITSDVPRSRPIVEKSFSAGQMIQEPSPASGSLTAV